MGVSPNLLRVARARSAIGRGTVYRLGRGGFDPRAPHPGPECDCSGFAAWTLGMSRRPKLGRLWWIETTNIVRDATGRRRVFTQIPGPVPGCLVVYGDRGGRQGHVGVVTRVSSQFSFDIVDCSSGSWRHGLDAIRERSGRFMVDSGAIFVALRQDM